MNLENYIESQFREIKEKGLLDPEFLELYVAIDDKILRDIFSSLHKQYVALFKSMNERLPTGDYAAHFWAEPSRQLLSTIEITLGLYRSLKNSKFAFEIDNYYLKLLEACLAFLNKSGGSTLPTNMDKVVLYYTQPIFSVKLSQKISRGSNEVHYKLKQIGEGSYALVFKFRDEYYSKDFVLKRAKADLIEKELERFKREFEEMKKLSSPYITEVYAFEESRNEYIMEYMDFSLDKYIERNNGKITPQERRNISFQILKAFSYLHSKNLMHRDISPKNILLKQYDDTLVVKVSDFGLVKTLDSSLTSPNTEFKGYFNDPALMTEGFDNYSTPHETYALTKLLFFVLTGKTSVSSISDPKLADFVNRGLHVEKANRYQSIDELSNAFRACCLVS